MPILGVDPTTGAVAQQLPPNAAQETNGNLALIQKLLANMIDNQVGQTKLLKSILITLGNNGSGWVDTEEATEMFNGNNN